MLRAVRRDWKYCEREIYAVARFSRPIEAPRDIGIALLFKRCLLNFAIHARNLWVNQHSLFVNFSSVIYQSFCLFVFFFLILIFENWRKYILSMVFIFRRSRLDVGFPVSFTISWIKHRRGSGTRTSTRSQWDARVACFNTHSNYTYLGKPVPSAFPPRWCFCHASLSLVPTRCIRSLTADS